MADTDNVRGYRVGNPPVLPDGDRRFLVEELQKVSQALIASQSTQRMSGDLHDDSI
jgi:hypothetical protein